MKQAQFINDSHLPESLTQAAPIQRLQVFNNSASGTWITVMETTDLDKLNAEKKRFEGLGYDTTKHEVDVYSRSTP